MLVSKCLVVIIARRQCIVTDRVNRNSGIITINVIDIIKIGSISVRETEIVVVAAELVLVVIETETATTRTGSKIETEIVLTI